MLMTVVSLLALCGGGKQTLHLYTWEDYISPSVITKFEQRYHCSVIISYFDSNEAMYTRLKSGASGYDLLVPSSYMAKVLFEQNMIRELDHSQLKNLNNLDYSFVKKSLDPELRYSVPYLISYTGIAYNKKMIRNFRASWAMFDRRDLTGRMTMLNDMREVIGAALKYNGFSYNSINPADLSKAKATAIRWRKNLSRYDVDEAKLDLASGKLVLIQTYNGDAIQVINKNSDIAFALPVEGTSIGQDNLVIPVKAKNPVLAYRFIEFILEPENSKTNMEFAFNLSPNREGKRLLDRRFVNNPAINPPDSIMKKSDYLMDLGESTLKYSILWDEIRSSM